MKASHPTHASSQGGQTHMIETRNRCLQLSSVSLIGMQEMNLVLLTQSEVQCWTVGEQF